MIQYDSLDHGSESELGSMNRRAVVTSKFVRPFVWWWEKSFPTEMSRWRISGMCSFPLISLPSSDEANLNVLEPKAWTGTSRGAICGWRRQYRCSIGLYRPYSRSTRPQLAPSGTGDSLRLALPDSSCWQGVSTRAGASVRIGPTGRRRILALSASVLPFHRSTVSFVMTSLSAFPHPKQVILGLFHLLLLQLLPADSFIPPLRPDSDLSLPLDPFCLASRATGPSDVPPSLVVRSSLRSSMAHSVSME